MTTVSEKEIRLMKGNRGSQITTLRYYAICYLQSAMGIDLLKTV